MSYATAKLQQGMTPTKQDSRQMRQSLDAIKRKVTVLQAYKAQRDLPPDDLKADEPSES